MADLNKFEFGQVIRANMRQDVSTNIGLTFILQPKNGTPKNSNAETSSNQPLNAIIRNGVDGVVVGTVAVAVGDEIFAANEYLEYTTKIDDLDISGLWRVKGEADISSTSKVVGDYRNITVLD
jgi:hypothetical protein